MEIEIILLIGRYCISARLVDFGCTDLTDFLQSETLRDLLNSGFTIYQVVHTNGPKAMWPLVQMNMDNTALEFRFDDTRAIAYPKHVTPYIKGGFITQMD